MLPNYENAFIDIRKLRVEKNNREIRITTSWIVKIDEDFPRLTSCYIID